jgi:signal transduction histidine kinase
MTRFADRVRHTLGFRLGLWYAGVFVASVALLFTATYALLSRSLAQRDRQIVEDTLRRYAVAYATDGFDELQRLIATDRQGARTEGLLVRIEGPRSHALFYNVPGVWEELDLRELNAATRRGQFWASIPGPGGVELEVATALLSDGTIVQVGRSSENRVEILRRFRALMAMASLVAALVGVGGGIVMTRRALQPLNRLVDTVQEIVRTGRLAARVPTRDTGDALDQVGALFNTMLTRIEGLIEAMRGSLDNVAHDLRTPLTRLRSVSEAALHARDADVETYRGALSDCLEESERVVSMLTTLMDISEAETGTLGLARADVSVADVLADSVALYEEVADERQVAVHWDAPVHLSAWADPTRLRQVVANLLDNAIKYTPQGGRVALSATDAGREVTIAVSDTGIGIPPGEIPRIWDRLYRGDKSRSQRGLGLGLSLVKAVVAAHGGRVDVTSTVGQGSTFTVTLPSRP